MRYLRMRLRSSILFGLLTLTLFFLLTLYILIWSTIELEKRRDYTNNEILHIQPPKDISFWSALDQTNVYDLQATIKIKTIKQSLFFSRKQIDNLHKLIHQNHNSTWNSNKSIDINSNVTNSKFNFNFTIIKDNILTKHVQIQLREYIQYTLIKWKDNHQNDSIRTLADIMHESLAQDEPMRLNTTWYEYIKTVTNYHVYEPNSAIFRSLLAILRNGKIFEASEMPQGTQIKIILDLSNGIQGLLKPYRVPRNYQTQPDHFYFNDIERHHAEIAAFHVDKVLGFHRVPPVFGRFINITRDIKEKATNELAKTFFLSPANNTCFRGHCSYYCDTSHAICGKPYDHLEGSVQILLPRPPEVAWHKITHPYRRSYSSLKKAQWETNENFCYQHILIDEDYHSRLLLDMMDLSAFDFLIGNLDRHHMMRISAFGLNTGLVYVDNGRSFGRYDYDDLSILAPLKQCCFFRYSTFQRLYHLYRQGLSKQVKQSLDKLEQLQMILIDEHLQALDRRLEILFLHLNKCIEIYSVNQVIIDDGIN